FDVSKDGSDIYLVDVLSGQVTQTKRLLDGPASVTFSADGNRAYVPIAQNNRVSFLDLAGLNEFASIALGRLTDGAQMRRQISDAATAGGNELFVAATGSGIIWTLDAGSGKLLTQIESKNGPLALIADSGGKLLYTIA